MFNFAYHKSRAQVLVQLNKKTLSKDSAIQLVSQIANQEGVRAGYLLGDGRNK